ncbi:MAG: hypothetical protein AAB834_05370, partial [Patescibacteria group bacterium]
MQESPELGGRGTLVLAPPVQEAAPVMGDRAEGARIMARLPSSMLANILVAELPDEVYREIISSVRGAVDVIDEQGRYARTVEIANLQVNTKRTLTDCGATEGAALQLAEQLGLDRGDMDQERRAKEDDETRALLLHTLGQVGPPHLPEAVCGLRQARFAARLTLESDDDPVLAVTARIEQSKRPGG